MGDRGNIYLVEYSQSRPEDKGIYFYFHWEGCALRQMLKDALKFAEPRWDDAHYATRVLASRLFAAHTNDLTGAGISLYPTSGEYNILVVDFERQRVYSMREGLETNVSEWPGEYWPFNQYVAVEHPAEREYGDK